MRAAEAAGNISFSDDPFDMDMSGFVPAGSGIFRTREAWMNSRLAGAAEHFGFLDGAEDADTLWSLIRQAPLYMERKLWSSLAVVLLLHATFAYLFSIYARPPAESPVVIEAQLVLLPEGSNQTGGPSGRGGPQAGDGAKKALPAPPAAVPSHPAARVDKVLRPVQKIHTPARISPGKIVRVFHHSEQRKEVRTVQPAGRLQGESGSTQYAGQSSFGTPPGGLNQSGSGAAGGAPGHGGSGNRNGPGGSGPSEIGFGSPGGPRFLHVVSPTYPALAKRLAKKGTVLLRVTIDTSGRPVKVEVLRKAGFGMDEEAVRAVEESTFVPARRDGKPYACTALLPIRFVLERS